MIRFILFDAYGTLFSTGTASVDATRKILQKHGRTDIDAADFYAKWKVLRAEMIRDMTEFFCEAEVFRTTLHTLCREYGIDGNADDDVRIMLDTWGTRDAFPETARTLADLTQTVCIASTTDTEPLLRDLQRNGLTAGRVYTSESLRVYKPHRAFYKKILDDLCAEPEEVLFVGDSLTDDVWGPAQLRIKTCHVNRKRTPYRDIVPDYIVSSLNELPDLLKKMTDTQNIYDNQIFFEGYQKLRENPYSANNLEEKPALFSLAPDLHGKAVLDLGCGYGENCKAFRDLGASYVLGVDLSEKMLAVAKKEHPELAFLRADMNDLSNIDGQFDVIFSSLAVHYIEDFEGLAKSVLALLNDGGTFVFSQEHPLTTAPLAGACWTKDENGNALHYNLSDYTKSGKRITSWIIDGVVKYHRTFSEIVCALTDAGFVIEKMLEPAPTEETIARDIKWEKCLHKPNFLLVRARKNG